MALGGLGHAVIFQGLARMQFGVEVLVAAGAVRWILVSRGLLRVSRRTFVVRLSFNDKLSLSVKF